jgi:Prokaryotic N-terminal methylation motif
MHPRRAFTLIELLVVIANDDQGGGLIWRAKDKNNYYIARYNPLEDNFRVYKVERGKRTMFKNADIPHTPGWHTLRVTMRGTHIDCFYDGKKYLECDDTTFPDTGMIGLWSKADAQSHFDELTLRVPE